MKPDQGLFQADFDDYHAVLGVPITADAKVVRKRYLMIARKLHPDSLSGAAAVDAQRASEILSKLVNPAYETLSQEKACTEHMLVLKLKGQLLRRSGTAPTVTSTAAQDLLKAPNVEQAYCQAVNSLAAHQFDQLDVVATVMGNLSELNLVYLYRSQAIETPPASATTSAKATESVPGTSQPPSAAPSTARNTQSSILESYINRAQEYERNKDYSRAILELREAVKTYPNSGPCHSYLALVYLKAGQATMARIHAKRALEINPQDEQAQTVQSRVDKTAAGAAGGAAKGSSPKASTPRSSSAKTPDKGGGFFGLFGGKKKS
jgi:tetratricopeptide (TPR) repeat protein